MKIEFICANHRHWLLERPAEALNWWEKSFDTGKYFQELRMWDESVRPLGCAFDAATICLEQSKIIDSKTIEQFSRSAQCLVYSLLKLGQLDIAQGVVNGVNLFIRKLDTHVFDRRLMLDMQRKLHLFLAAHSAVTPDSLPNKADDVSSVVYH